MVVQYPHTVNCKKPSQSTVVNGIPVSGIVTDLSYVCRYRPNTSSKTVQTADGETVVFRGTCYVPLPNTEIAVGDVIEVPGQIVKGTVLQVYNAQMRTRIIL